MNENFYQWAVAVVSWLWLSVIFWVKMHNELTIGAERMSMKSMEVSKDSKRSCTWHGDALEDRERGLGRREDNECLTEIQLAVENVESEEMKLAILSWERRSISTTCDGEGVNGWQ